MYGLRIQRSNLVDANDFPCFSALWLVGDSDAVSLRWVWTRDGMRSFLRIFILSILSSHGYMCTHGHPHISSHGPLKTSSHLAIHIHVSPILTRLCCGKPSEVVPSFPFKGAGPKEWAQTQKTWGPKGGGPKGGPKISPFFPSPAANKCLSFLLSLAVFSRKCGRDSRPWALNRDHNSTRRSEILGGRRAVQQRAVSGKGVWVRVVLGRGVRRRGSGGRGSESRRAGVPESRESWRAGELESWRRSWEACSRNPTAVGQLLDSGITEQ